MLSYGYWAPVSIRKGLYLGQGSASFDTPDPSPSGGHEVWMSGRILRESQILVQIMVLNFWSADEQSVWVFNKFLLRSRFFSLQFDDLLTTLLQSTIATCKYL